MVPYITQDDLDNWFTYHAPREGQPQKYEALRTKAKEFAELIVALCPECPDTVAAIRDLRNTLMAANLALACNTKD